LKIRPKLIHVTTVPMTLEFFLRGQIAFMRSKGFEVMAVSSPGTSLDNVAARDGIKVFPVAMNRFVSPYADLVALTRLYRIFKEQKPDIVHSSTGKAGPLGMLAAALAGVPVRIYTIRGIMLDRANRLMKPIFWFAEWLSCALAHEVFAVSDSVAEIITGFGICPQSKIKTLASGSSNGVDAEGRFNPSAVPADDVTDLRRKLNIPEAGKVIGYVGRIVNGKGVVELGSAWLGLRDRFPDVYLIMIGPIEPQDPAPAEVIEPMRQDPRIILVDYVHNEKMPLYYSLMDYLVLPTYSEGFPNVVLEAAAMERPTVATNVSGCVDAVVDGVTGLIAEVRDSDSLRKAMEFYLENPTIKDRHGVAARKRALADYRPETIWLALYEEYENAVRRRFGLR
jgi:glycosyltransferase involved in cell wall biosynthesis